MIILASASPARRAMLDSAGVSLAVDVAGVDEEAVKQALRLETGNPLRVAETLAELKAIKVSARHPGMLVLGADQMLDYDGIWFDKPKTRDDARHQLKMLRHHTHRLSSAVVAAKDGRRVWYHAEQARLTMRNFSDAFLEHYLERVGEAALGTVGAYQLEGLGAQLFLSVEGDFFTVLGLPLLPVLDFLRENGELTQ
ncbi:septum formation protein Maf [Paramagnetospirillum marisnigri]|uniref:Nucleoside triphosphate pyrophosphatase n=1 Tax=Paramagnetospirillum marisnigri TaxID=1285242 RepID=A0A178MQF4_9PROT|nr:Maf family protein [Paramagnetospirillum marisnigri]OAN50338.1 septum formation protein Maf [Paramagnetospirillum marisnigri]